MTTFTLSIPIAADRTTTSVEIAAHLRTLADRLAATPIPMVEASRLTDDDFIALADRSVYDSAGERVGSWEVSEPETFLAQKRWLREDFVDRLKDRVENGRADYTLQQIETIVDNLGSTNALTDCTDADWDAVDMILDDAISVTALDSAQEADK